MFTMFHPFRRTMRPISPAFVAAFALLSCLPLTVFAQSETPDATVMAKIRDEGMNRSQYMATLGYLSDVIGARLTCSQNLKRANLWTRDKLTAWGMQNAHLEAWGPFGRGWELERFSAQVVSPTAFPLIAYPKAWSPGLKKPLNTEVVYFDAATEEDLAKFAGKLKGKIVLMSPMSEVKAHFEPEGHRDTTEELTAMANATATPDAPRRPNAAGAPNVGGQRPPLPAGFAFRARKTRFAMDEGASVLVETARGDGGTVFVQQAAVPVIPPKEGDTTPPKRVSPWDAGADKMMIPQVALAAEHYNRLVRMVQAGEPVKMQIEFAAHYTDLDKGMANNTVAEIPGSDKKDEIVICGGHMDSWQGGTGATDNGAGVACCMEAMRILKAVGVQPKRTIRVVLWSGEEQGLFGSRAYVAQHFGTPQAHTPENEKVAGYFNLDNGTGKIRGVYCQGNMAVMPIFTEWLKPFADLDAQTITIRNTGGTDHLSFDAVGIPGFQFVQDPIEYGTRTHHSNMDVFDRIQEADMKQASVIMAAFLYNTAMRDTPLPRKPVTKTAAQ